MAFRPDRHHGLAIDAVCMACAVLAIESWVTSDVCDYVTVRVLA